MSIGINCNDFSDLELHRNYQSSGKSDWLGCIYKRYARFMVGVCMKYLKDYDNSMDSTLQIFEDLIEKLKKHEISNLKSWLHSVTRNHCLMQLRKNKLVVTDSGEPENEITPVMEYRDFLHQEGEKSLENKLTDLETAINQLSVEQRTCIDLFYLQEKCYNEVAEITGYSLNQVKSYLQNGKRNLQLLMTKKNV